MLPFKQFDGDLGSQLEALGLNSQTTNALAEARISEQTYAPLNESKQDEVADTEIADSILVSEATLDRISALIDTESLSADEAESILDGLSERAPSAENYAQFESIVTALSAIGSDDSVEGEGSIEEALLSIAEAIDSESISGVEALRALVALAETPVEEGLEDLRDEVLEGLTDLDEVRQMLKKIKGVFKKVKVKRMSSADRAKSRARYRKTKAKRKIARRKKMKTAAFKKSQGMLSRARKRFGLGEGNDLASRLQGRLLAESNSVEDEFNMVARIGRIFDLLAERVSDDVVDVMEEQYDILRSGLYESAGDLEAACRPCVTIIAECLKDIEQGNC